MTMRSPQARDSTPLNGGFETPSPRPRIQTRIQSVSEHKLRRFNFIMCLFRFAAFCFSLAASIFMFTNSRGSGFPSWHDFNAFRFVAIANAIVALYSLFEVWAAVWEISAGATLFPEILQVWFDFGHDQVFAYMLLSAVAAGTELARRLRVTDKCTGNSAFCVQNYISIGLGFSAFFFLVMSSLLSGFRVASFIINGSRFHL